MQFHTENWTLEYLLDTYNKGLINLNPPYQRNDIWSIPTKKKLIDSITREYPLPMFFLHLKINKIYDVVDGQQRIRAIIGYMEGLFKNQDNRSFNENENLQFKKYKITVTIIDSADEESTLSDFYYRVNKFGIKLNRPEILKAQFKSTNFLNLVETLAGSEDFQKLNLFSNSVSNRMTDLDFVSELLGLLEFGIQEKKKSADELFVVDITMEKFEFYYSSFFEVLQIFLSFNDLYPIANTRFKQKNDFYTLWYFTFSSLYIDKEILEYFYKILALIGVAISPSNEECISMANYAFNCVTQSNSKTARKNRHEFLIELFLNTESKPNNTQLDILKYYDLDNNAVIKKGKFLTLDGQKLQNSIGFPKLF